MHHRLGVESLESRRLLSSVPYGATYRDTAEYMLGEVYVTVVLLESDGSIDASTEDWSPDAIDGVKRRIIGGLDWWERTLDALESVHALDFVIDFTYANDPIATQYEPISRPSDDHALWGTDFLVATGSGVTGEFRKDMLQFNHAQRVTSATDWAFTIFVVNNANDADGAFDRTGTYPYAHAVRPSLVVLANSSARVIAHETGHAFYAFDEYPGGAAYDRHRGYYNTQNLNAFDENPDLQSRVPSIMAERSLQQIALQNHTSSPSSLEMIGWKDSDGDGVFDVLDVPHTLDGVSFFDPDSRLYRFVGQSRVNTLPNRNPSGLGNDITLNRISRVQYRVDGSPWMDGTQYDTYETNIDFSTGPLPPGNHQIDIRTIDDRTGVTSPVIHGSTTQSTSGVEPGIRGVVFHDSNRNGKWNEGEATLEGWQVTLRSEDLSDIPSVIHLEPDAYPHGTRVNDVIPEATLRAMGDGVDSDVVTVGRRNTSSTGNRVFANLHEGEWFSTWLSRSRVLRIDFSSPVSMVSIDAVSNSELDYGRLEVFDAHDRLLARYTTRGLPLGQFETMRLARPNPEIAYAVARGHAYTSIRLDNLRFGRETEATTNASGVYVLPHGGTRERIVKLGIKEGWYATTPKVRTIDYDPVSQTATVSFGVAEAQESLQAGDANGDSQFNQLDIVLVLQKGKYLTGQPANWSEGDWDRDGVFSQLDIITALRTGTYLQEPVPAMAENALYGARVKRLAVHEEQLVDLSLEMEERLEFLVR